MKKIAVFIAAIFIACNVNLVVYAEGDNNTNIEETTETILEENNSLESTDSTYHEIDSEDTTNSEDSNVHQDNTDMDYNSTIEGTKENIEVSQDEEKSIEETAGVTPDNFFYALDKALDELRILLTFDEKQKLDIISKIAEERLAESDIMTEKEKIELAKKFLEDFNGKIEQVTEKLEDMLELVESSRGYVYIQLLLFLI